METMRQIQARNCEDCAVLIQALKQEEEHSHALTQQVRELTFRIENLTKLLKMARYEYLEQNFDGEHDCQTPYDIYKIGPHDGKPCLGPGCQYCDEDEAM